MAGGYLYRPRFLWSLFTASPLLALDVAFLYWRPDVPWFVILALVFFTCGIVFTRLEYLVERVIVEEETVRVRTIRGENSFPVGESRWHKEDLPYGFLRQRTITMMKLIGPQGKTAPILLWSYARGDRAALESAVRARFKRVPRG